MALHSDNESVIAQRCASLGLSRMQAELLAHAGPFPCDLYHALGIDERSIKDWLKIAAQTASVSYRGELTSDILLSVLTSGDVPPEYAAHINYLFEETPVRVLIGAVEQAAQQSGVPIVDIWQCVRQLGCKRLGAS